MNSTKDVAGNPQLSNAKETPNNENNAHGITPGAENTVDTTSVIAHTNSGQGVIQTNNGHSLYNAGIGHPNN